MTEPADELRRGWEREARAWIGWARSRELDHAFWRLNLPALVDLLPPPGRLTVDIGCGEGRVARHLTARGYRVVGIESSAALAEAAREATPPLDVHLADAAAMPLEDAAADLAIASLSLMNMHDLRGVVGETARVLEPGGAFCFSILHPLNSFGDAGPQASYFNEVRYTEILQRGGKELTLHEVHRPLEAYMRALDAGGFTLERLVEPRPDAAHVADHPEAARWLTRPGFLHVRARRR